MLTCLIIVQSTRRQSQTVTRAAITWKSRALHGIRARSICKQGWILVTLEKILQAGQEPLRDLIVHLKTDDLNQQHLHEQCEVSLRHEIRGDHNFVDFAATSVRPKFIYLKIAKTYV